MGGTEWHVETKETRLALCSTGLCVPQGWVGGGGRGWGCEAGAGVVWRVSSMWRKVIGAGVWGRALTWRVSSKWRGADGTGCHQPFNMAVLHFLGEGGMSQGCK